LNCVGPAHCLYEVDAKVLNQAVKRNLDRFPEDFMFQLTVEESARLRSQIVTSNAGQGRGGRRYLPYAFTEQGVAMLSSVLRSKRAVMVNIEIMRAFVRLRQILGAHADLARKLAALERKYDSQFKAVFDAIRELMTTPPAKKRPIGFGSWEEKKRSAYLKLPSPACGGRLGWGLIDSAPSPPLPRATRKGGSLQCSLLKVVPWAPGSIIPVALWASPRIKVKTALPTPAFE
jgi:hypothetical protein